MKVKTSELEGTALDYAAAKAVGHDVSYGQWGTLHYGAIIPQPVDLFPDQTVPFKPSTDWSQGGTLIENFEVTVYPPRHMTDKCSGWAAQVYVRNHPRILRGEAPLIAACRAIVASELGDTVDVPDELVEKANG